MSAPRFIKQLRREATRNPKKAAILGLLVAVALYFWAPLVWGMFGSKEGASLAPTDAKVVVNEQFRPGTTGTVVASATAAVHPWQTVVQWRKDDPLTVVADTLKLRRDPFRAVHVPAVEEKKEEVAKANKIPEAIVTPETLGLKLSSTIVGPARRVALINGRSFLEGQVVQCGTDGQEVAFRIVEVHARHAVLEREGERFELAIPEKKPSSRIELSGSPK